MRPPLIPSALFLVALGVGARAVSPAPSDLALAAAHQAWDEGDYIRALEGYLALVEGPDGDAHVRAIALQTGELFRTRELTPNGRNPRFSADGRFVAFETGLEVSRRTTIARNDAGLKVVADLPGVSASFAPNRPVVAYLRIKDTPDVAAASAAVDLAPLAAQNRNALLQALAWQILRHSTITIRDLTTHQEREVPTPDLIKAGLTFGADGASLFFLGGVDGNDARNDIYTVAEGRPAIPVADAEGLKGPPLVDPSGQVVLYVTPPVNPFRRPQPPGGAPPPAAGAPGPPPAPRPPTFGVIELATGKTRVIEGSAPALSGDGRTLAYVNRTDTETSLFVGPPLGPMRPVRQTTDRLDAPALSPDGQRLAFQRMVRDDWEIVVTAQDGSDERRLTRDVQHDVVPRFIAADRLIATVGEPRHRRSFLHDLTAGDRLRLFHNNTVRTIAPEYQWVPSRDGSQLLVGAERDGDTVSPERGVYLIDLRQRIEKRDLVKRLTDNLAAERALRAGATRTFAPIAPDVRRAADAVSVSRIFAYEKALFDFDSKHISRPGNARASEYLFSTYASFGYQPEYQWFDHRQALGGKTANVIARLEGTTNPELVYVVSSHYDSVAGGPGADDDSSGTAALLEAARVLASRPQPATIVFASFTGEESGLLGSREYVRRAVDGKTRIIGALNNDMIGWSNDHRLDNTIRYSNPGIRDIQHGAAMLFTRLITYDAVYFKGTDAAAYYDAFGDIVGGIGSYPVLSNPHYHQAHDLLDTVNHQLIAETSRTTVATLMLLASSPSRIARLSVDSATPAATTVSWVPSPEKQIASYTVAYRAPGAPERRLSVTSPRASLPALPAGSVISVKAVNARGLEGWDWAHVTVGVR
jgi:hypothetical protein